MRNALQDQLLKAGLAKKSKVDQIAREQAKQRQAKSVPAVDAEHLDAERLRRELAERDRALQAERNAQSKTQEMRAQARQIIEQTMLPAEGEIDYRFSHDGAIRSVRVTDAVRRQLAKGSLVIARLDASYAIVPRTSAAKVAARDATMIAVDHIRTPSAASDAVDDPFYSQFKVPDDLVW